jgi:hydrogenase maturation protein HypF
VIAPACGGRRRLALEVHGAVQGVGFRPWVYRVARALELDGWVVNDVRGLRVEVEGAPEAVDGFRRRLETEPPAHAVIGDVTERWLEPTRRRGFAILASDRAGEPTVTVLPDLAACPACLAELADPADRRHGYPFINCTECGPRFSIVRELPYDRPNTTMAGFALCPACAAEYRDPLDRRFHAQPNACPVCGPRLVVVRANGQDVACPDAIVVAANALRAGLIVAVKGIGGFHLACDATAEDVVMRLRTRKQRDEKPFAVMVRTLEQAEALAIVNADEAELLTSPERPIVLLQRRVPSVLAASIAPDNPLVGVMLPYSPLHHLLLGDTRRPLVMTSGNVSDEPIVYSNDEAVRRLGPLVDLLLLHDREIVTRCDDSVARVIDGAPVLLRRSRGYVPRAIRLGHSVASPILACGALLKNTFCLAEGQEAYLGPHIGDLDHLETFQSFESAINRAQKFLGITPEVIAYDLHPGYHSTHYALARPETRKVGVQHHHAHVASLLAEHRISDAMLGIAYDGTGYGANGVAWGGEILRADFKRFERLATFRPLRLAGGDAAIRAPWRIALALLLDAFDGDAPLAQLSLFDDVRPRDLHVVRQMLEAGVQVVPAHGVGRYFDAIGALLLERTKSTYEGQVAMELNAAADPHERGEYTFDLQMTSGVIEIDLRRGVRALTHDLLAGQSPARLAARFHRTISAATAATVAEIVGRDGRLPIGLTGGCFQNALLVSDVCARLADHDVFTHRHVPPGDGGLALGQAMVAAAQES